MKTKAIMAVGLLCVASTSFAVSELEPNDVRAFANAAGPLPATLTGTLANDPGSFGTYDDFWSFAVVSGNTYEVVATGGSVPFPLDIGLEVQNAAGSSVAATDANGDNLGETLQFVAAATETYYLDIYEATGTLNAISGYTVTITQIASVEDWNLY